MVKRIENIITLDLLACFLVLGLFFQSCFPTIKTMLNIICIIIGIVVLYFEYYNFKFSKKIYLINISVLVATIINHFLIGNLSLSYAIKFVFQYFPLAYYFAMKQKKNLDNWLITSLVILLIVEISWILSPDNYILFDDLSRNYVSIFLLIVIFVYLKTANPNKITFPINIIIPFLYLFLSIHAIGRGGILSGILYLALASLYVYKTNGDVKKFVIKRKKQLMYGCLIFFILFFVIFRNQIFNLIFSRFVDSTAQNSNIGRMNVYTTYFQMAFSNVKYLLFGVPYNEISSRLSFITGNLHCSYLQLHACFGIFGVIFVIYSLYRTITYITKKKDYYNLIFLIVFLFRILTDFAICGFVTDFIMLYYIILPMVARRDRNEKRVTIKSSISKL